MAQPTKPIVITALNAVAETTTSSAINIENAKKVTMLFTRAAHSSGNHVFTVTGSLDGTTFVACNKLVNNAANTNSQTILRTASITLSANGTSLVSLDLQHDAFKEIKITATETTDGTATAVVLIER